MKILNLYAGIGGNRKLWGDDHEITAVEWDKDIAAKYKAFFPKDKIVIEDAHQYLVENYFEYDFIWSSPPCPTHTRMNISNSLSPYKDNTAQLERGGGIKPRYADMALYQEIIFLRYHFKGKYCVENVMSYYKPLIPPFEMGKHYFWTNFVIRDIEVEGRGMGKKDTTKETLTKRKGFGWEELEGVDRELVLRNCVEPELGLHIFEEAFRELKTLL